MHTSELSAPRPTGPAPTPPPLPLRRPWAVLLAALLFLLLTAVLSGGTLGVLKSGGFDDPAADSVAAAKLLQQHFPAAQPDLFVLVRDAGGNADSPASTAAGRSVLDQLSHQPGVRVVASYYDGADPALRSADGSAGLTAVAVAGDQDAVGRKVRTLHTLLAGRHGSSTVQFGGIGQINNDLTDRIAQDLAIAESVAIPLTLLLLVLVFRGVVAALLPLAIGVLAIVGALAALWGLAEFTSVSIFSTNLITALGLGLAVDYSLLIVARYRQERGQGDGDLAALRRTLATAGRTVLFSATIVATVLICLLVFRLYFLRSFAFAGVATVVIAVLGALGPLPAALLLLGDRIDKWPIGRVRAERPAAELRLWGRIAGAAMRRPGAAGLLVTGALLVLALPLGHAQFGIPDARALPAGTESRQVSDLLTSSFPGGDGDTLTVVAPVWTGDPSGADLASYARALSAVPGVDEVASPAGVFAAGAATPAPAPQGMTDGSSVRFDLQTKVVPYSAQGSALAQRVRAVPVPGDRLLHVAGLAAQLADTTSSLSSRLPWAVGLAVLGTLVLLLLATGSVLLPVKAVLFNALGLAAVTGAMVWVFVDGHLSGLLGFTPSPLAITMPVLLVCVAYALSMDYEVFLLSRIKERHVAGDAVELSVRAGLGESGPIITAAAGLLAVSFFAIGLSGVSLVKFFGLGTGIAILLDAVLIRGVLVPVFFRLAGERAWWAPAWVKRLTRRFEMASGH
ncbi:RND superfamily putative drug exporter [Kitasatospora sp. MAA4]|uniref:MMPL family transporter n=1 Tax=Kitasatospora sp. MAA4 TaxID=3035093 RepID=UPI002474AE21|nr:MMPL family transporter [Kitasatospora sp. MAA4]MDH6136908.1 RND superfamily putative drug exporter [Kitasatospora sp. MAA4]